MSLILLLWSSLSDPPSLILLCPVPTTPASYARAFVTGKAFRSDGILWYEGECKGGEWHGTGKEFYPDGGLLTGRFEGGRLALWSSLSDPHSLNPFLLKSSLSDPPPFPSLLSDPPSSLILPPLWSSLLSDPPSSLILPLWRAVALWCVAITESCRS